MKNFKYIGKVKINNFKNKINNFNNELWNYFDFRQKTFEVHKETKTIPLIFDTDFRLNNPTYLDEQKTFKDEFKIIENKLKKIYGKGFIIRAILVLLKSNSQINRHIDTGKSLSICHRIHIPIITNKDVLFEIDNEIKNLKEGEMWEINNSEKMHSVVNNSNADRIHLIVDWIND
jgi:aspartyl/asparaginyl beta-hydroxylase (cupin superfamily)